MRETCQTQPAELARTSVRFVFHTLGRCYPTVTTENSETRGRECPSGSRGSAARRRAAIASSRRV